MLRNVCGQWYFGKRSSSTWQMSVLDLGNGHKETTISRPIEWEDVALTATDLAELARDKTAEELAERREANRRRAAQRAKTRVRRLVKVMGLDALLTLTYRDNQCDLALMKRHFEAFTRRMRRLVPGFRYVAAFERQKRGAWHAHLAIHRLPRELPSRTGVRVKSYNIVRAVWRDVVGDLGGNIDQQRRKRGSRQSAGKLAAYLSKYMVKAFAEGDDWSNRYSASSADVPEPVRLRFVAESLADLVGLAFTEVAAGDEVGTMWLSRFGDVFYLSSEGGRCLHSAVAGLGVGAR